jgi:hypothetical protein
MLTHQDLGTETDRRIARALARRNEEAALSTPAASFTLDHDSASDLRRILERDGRSGTTRQVRFEGRIAFVYLGFARGGEPFVHGIGESPELAVAEAFLNSEALTLDH